MLCGLGNINISPSIVMIIVCVRSVNATLYRDYQLMLLSPVGYAKVQNS
jgi:hypothetical protein